MYRFPVHSSGKEGKKATNEIILKTNNYQFWIIKWSWRLFLYSKSHVTFSFFCFLRRGCFSFLFSPCSMNCDICCQFRYSRKSFYITQRHHFRCAIHPNNIKSMCQVQAQCWGIFEPTCQHQPDEDGSPSRIPWEIKISPKHIERLSALLIQ